MAISGGDLGRSESAWDRSNTRLTLPPRDPFRVAALGNSSTAGIDLPVVSIVKVALIPATIAGFLLLLSLFDSRAVSGGYIILAAFAFVLSALVFDEASFYRGSARFPIGIALYATLSRWLVVVIIIAFLGYSTGLQVHFSAVILGVWSAFTPLAVLGVQAAARAAVRRYIVSTQPTRTAVIVGANRLSSALRRKIMEDDFLNIRVAGFFDDRQIERLPGDTQTDRLGPLSALADYAKKHGVSVIYLCLPIVWHARILDLLDALRDTTASIYFVPDVFVVELIQARIDRITGLPTVALCETPFFGIRGIIKRVVDIIVSSLILLLTWPVLLAITIGIRLTSSGPAIFRQTRYGLDGRSIIVYKFRTMRVCEDGTEIVQATRDDARITKLGHFLRRTSLDELPQFINVLQGSMSIVGPRPHAVSHNEMYRKVIKGYMVRHKVKPGITGWAQVNGFRGETETLDKMARRVELDLEYLRNWSLGLDFFIIIRTVALIFSDAKAY